MPASSNSTPATVTIFTKLTTPTDPYGDLLSKHIYIDGCGELVSDGSPCRMANGTATMVQVPDAEALAHLIADLRPADALALGSIRHHNGAICNVVTARALASLPSAQRGNGTIARDREHVSYRANAPAWLLIDHDAKGMPPSVAGQIDAAGNMWQALLAVVPGLARAGRVSRSSTSAGISNATTGERYPGSGGEHHYVLVENGADVDRALQALHDRCWLHGLGWLLIGGAGQLLERSIVDPMVRFGERLCFEAPPLIEPPLVQDKSSRAPRPQDGAMIDTAVIIPALSEYERARVAEAKELARKALAPQAASVRADADRALAEKLVSRTGVPFATARRTVEARHRGALLPDMELQFDHLGTVTVREILADPDKHVGETLSDPIEGPDYGYSKAKVMRSESDPTRVFIHSFAHGRTLYDVQHDLRSAIAAVEKASKAHAADIMCAVAAAAALERDEIAQLIWAAARVSGVGVRALQARLKADTERRESSQRKAEDTARRAADHDPRRHRPVPPVDHEITPIVKELEEVLSRDTREEPPMRNINGDLVRVSVRTPWSLHQLAATGSNADAAARDQPTIPAPPEPTLAALSTSAVAMLIEEYFAYEVTDKDGCHLYNASLPAPFIRAFMGLKPHESILPLARAVNTAPLVAANGKVIAGIGLDRDSGLVHRIEPALLACVPSGDVTAAEAKDALSWLVNEWMIDVLVSTEGKLIAVMLCLTIIERVLLDEKPVFFITAGQRGGGKTTLLHMISAATLGRMAAAASWSDNQEERRKSVFSYFRQGVAFLVWDNIGRGSAVSCPEIEKAATSPEISDRVLGGSKFETVPTTTVMAFTGNAISPKGDLASRSARIPLEVDRPDPENRNFTHADVIEWTEQQRGKILRCLYTLLIYGGQRRPARQVAKTRFKRWWSLCGWPVELAATLLDRPIALDCTTVFQETEDEDEESTAVTTALRLLRERFGEHSADRSGTAVSGGDGWFEAKAIAELIAEGNRSRDQLDFGDAAKRVALADRFAEALGELSGIKRRQFSARSIGMILKTRLVGRPCRLDDTTLGGLRLFNNHEGNSFRVETWREGSWPKTRFSIREPAKTSPASPASPDNHPSDHHPIGTNGTDGTDFSRSAAGEMEF